MKTGRVARTVQSVSTLVEDVSADAQVQAAVEATLAAVDGLTEALANDNCESFDASPVDEATSSQSEVDSEVSSVAVAEATAEAVSETTAESLAESVAEAVASHSAMVGADDKVSKKDLVSLLEGFVRIIKTDEESTVTPVTAATSAPGTGINLSQANNMVVAETRVDDRTVEIDQLRGLVIEAQDTIIKLLTDRVDDRSRIATLEAQLALLPDLQAQADRAMSVAVRTEEYRTELSKMRFELDRFRLFRVRIEGEQRKGTVFNRIQKWLFSRPNRDGGDTTQRGDQ